MENTVEHDYASSVAAEESEFKCRLIASGSRAELQVGSTDIETNAAETHFKLTELGEINIADPGKISFETEIIPVLIKVSHPVNIDARRLKLKECAEESTTSQTSTKTVISKLEPDEVPNVETLNNNSTSVDPEYSRVESTIVSSVQYNVTRVENQSHVLYIEQTGRFQCAIRISRLNKYWDKLVAFSLKMTRVIMEYF